ncbi:LysR substrate-binding domain-containing protein [Acinetobacter baumannii]|nr:LysR substrate-binding domain-containing protein [Acinetobacter baumannii]
MDLTNSIDIRTLRFFISVYNAQNFSNVARKEDVSASMISRTIQQLEDALGQQLFYRNTRAITPTESGKLFFEYAKRITEQFDEAQKALQDKTIEPSGLVRINAPVFFGQRHIAPWLAGLSERYPRLLIELIQTDEFIDPLRESTDLIFRIGALTDSSFHARIFGTQKYHLAASLHYPLTPLLSSNNAESLMTAALHGMGIVLFPDWLIGEALKKGDLIKLLPEYEVAIKSHPQHIAAIYPNVRHPPLNIRAVIDYFAEIYGDTPYWQN